MNRKIIIITGYAAAGKTHFSLRLSQALNLPCFNKDYIKIALNRSIPVNNRAESKRLSAAAFDAIAHITEKFMETGQPLIIEANFVMRENHNHVKEGDVLRALVERYDYKPLTYLFTGDLPTLHKRFVIRDKQPERGRANRMWEEVHYADFEKTVTPLGAFYIGGEMIKIDATDFAAIDFDRHIEAAQLFLQMP